ncbi:MAG: pectate lyase [Planctomycetaceae bacterium]
MQFFRLGLLLVVVCSTMADGAEDRPGGDAARAAMRRAVDFFRTRCSAHGGYVYRVSSDGRYREGEEAVGPDTAWIEPPGTPAVGRAYLDAWRLTRDEFLLQAARETAQALLQGQLTSGGWSNEIEFAPEERAKHAYRVDHHPGNDVGRLRRSTTFDDDKSQSAARFLMELDEALKFQDAELHEASRFALDAFVEAQYPNGAWPQQFVGQHQSNASTSQVVSAAQAANYPAEWPREFPAVKYSMLYTLNDGLMSDMLALMFDAADVYQEDRYRQAAIRGADFLLLAQMPDPQPGWAQQYNESMHPAWARKFEPPALSGSESQGVMRTLMEAYLRTGDPRYIATLPKAIDYYRKSLLDDGQLARFYELRTNRPLYFTREYRLTYDDSDLPTHYAFVVGSGLDAIARQLDEVRAASVPVARTEPGRRPPHLSSKLAETATTLIETLDEPRAWVERARMKAASQSGEIDVIDSKTFARNLVRLAEYVAAVENSR